MKKTLLTIWCPMISGVLYSKVPYIPRCPIFQGALFSKVPYFLGAPFSRVPYFLRCPIFRCPIFPPPNQPKIYEFGRQAHKVIQNGRCAECVRVNSSKCHNCDPMKKRQEQWQWWAFVMILDSTHQAKPFAMARLAYNYVVT